MWICHEVWPFQPNPQINKTDVASKELQKQELWSS